MQFSFSSVLLKKSLDEAVCIKFVLFMNTYYNLPEALDLFVE